MTDFLASNNISAAQINADYERRQAEARQQEQREAAERGQRLDNEDQDGDIKGEEDDEDDDGEQRIETAASRKKRKREQEKTLAKIKAGKKKKGKRGGKDNNDEDDEWDMYTAKKPLPGQLENCEICEKRFTVTPYSKTGPEGGLLCTKCSKEQEAGKKKDEKAKKQSVGREKRRQTQSNLLDGIVQIGSKSLQELCIKVKLHGDSKKPTMC